MDFRVFLEKMNKIKASDLFITVGKPVCAKINLSIVNLTDEKLTPAQTQSIAFGLMNEQQKQEFISKKECNFAIQEPTLGRFRVNAFIQRSYMGMIFRRIESKIPTLEELNIQSSISKFAMLDKGLVLLVGATSCGKSSTLAALIGCRNDNSTGHIITIEEPIEFVHEHKSCIVTQREVGIDTDSYQIALKNALRQSPDVISLGEVRSDDTMAYAIQFAETGHLCLTTLHANNANQAIERIINFFPVEKHAQVFSDLSLNLKAVIAQQLLPTKDETNLIPAVEILINTPLISDAIKKGDINSLKDIMSKSTEQGMQTFDQSLFNLYKADKISYDNALKYADSSNELRLMIKLDRGTGTRSSLDDIGLKDK